MSRGQSLVELAVCAPVAVTLVMVAMAAVQVAGAQAGLDAATESAVAAAARAPDSNAATEAADAGFQGVIAGYPVSDPRLHLDVGTFERSGEVIATATGEVVVDPAGIHLGFAALGLHSRAAAPLEPWRSRT